jgi:dipeptidyl aminopeptidase/acylaminoacyl peptidase
MAAREPRSLRTQGGASVLRLARNAAISLRRALVAAALLPSLASPQPAAPPVEDFFRNPAFAAAEFAPDGKHLGVIVVTPGKRQQLAVLEAGAWEKSKLVAGFGNADIHAFSWVNNRRLIFSIIDLGAGMGEQVVTGFYAVDLDGENLRYLAGVRSATSRDVSHLLDPRTRLHSILHDGTDDVVVVQPGEDYTKPLRLNTRTGVTVSMTTTIPGGAHGWLLDRSGRPAYVVSTWDGEDKVARWDQPSTNWVGIARSPEFSDAFHPYFVGYNDELYVLANDAKGMAALYLFDKTTNRPENEPLLRIDGFDYVGHFQVDASARKILGAHFITDAPTTHWFDPEMRKVQAKVDAQLPSTNNQITCGACLSNRFLLVHATSDREPGVFYLYESETGRIEPLARERPWLDPRAMGTRDLFRVAARDGLTIPIWITLPPGYKKGRPYPMVVLVHGGPWVRGAWWSWSAVPQFLATRGYVVIEPEFRGSIGYGKALFRAGFKQWGLAMQDDVADATRWAITQGYADPKRICIAGASYGGYATLMGLIRNPDLYRCGINWVGVTDIELMYTSDWSDLSDQSKKYGMPVLIGDPKKDKEQLRNTSPLQLASRIAQPLLMAYGGADRRVPIEHGRKFYAAIAPTNANVEWVLYADEGHGWLLEKNRFDFYGRVEKFLAKNLKPAE